MPKNNSTKPNPKEVTFARDLGLFEATMIGIGAMIGAGIFVLTGIAAGEAGPASILAFGLNGFVTLLTAFAYAELASAIPRAGGGYSYVRMAFPGSPGFIAGWMLWFAYTVACSLYALGFASYFWEFFTKYTPGFSEAVLHNFGENAGILLVTLLIGLGFIWLNARGTEATGKAENALTISKLVVLAIFVYFGLLVIFESPANSLEHLTPFMPAGLGGVFVAMGLTFIAFEGYDLIATVAEEIKDPEKNIPRATFISLGVTVVIYLLILFVCLAAIKTNGEPTWQFLGTHGETAIVKAAEDFMPAFGVAIIVFGGLLSTMSALNATVMAASRVAFSMGRDRWLPKRISEISPTRRTPLNAVVLTGVILLGIALTLPLEAVGSAASLMFLLTFALVNLAVIALRRKYPEIPRRYKIPLYPVVPLLGFFLNIFLAVYQFNFQPIAWYVTIGWIAVGLLLYYSVFEKQSSQLEPQVLRSGRYYRQPDSEPSVVVALHNPDNVGYLLDIAYPVARQRGIRLVAITVVTVPRQMPIHEGMRFVQHREPLLHAAKAYAARKGFEIETDFIVAHLAADGILSAIEQHRAKALVMGWKGFTNARDRIFGEIADKVIRLAPCDLMVMKMNGKGKLGSCLLPTAGGPNARLGAEVISAVAADTGMVVTGGFIVPPEADEAQIEEGKKSIELTLKQLNPVIRTSQKIIHSKSIPGGIAKASTEFDLVVIGAAKETFFSRILFGEIPEKVARFSPVSVMLVKKYEGPIKSLIKRIMG